MDINSTVKNTLSELRKGKQTGQERLKALFALQQEKTTGNMKDIVSGLRKERQTGQERLNNLMAMQQRKQDAEALEGVKNGEIDINKPFREWEEERAALKELRP